MTLEPKPGAVINERYEILQRLGEGGFATVFKAHDRELGRSVAIKIMKLTWQDEDLTRFHREAKVLAQLIHRNIVAVYSMETLGQDSAMIVMEYVEGKSLRAILNDRNKLDYNTSKDILLQICEGLTYAHNAGLVHRDLSPANILLAGDLESPSVKIIDFGLSRLFVDDAGSAKLTQTGMILGNPPYMSPELARGEVVDYLSDIYALGCILYEMTSGKLAFAADNAVAILLAQQTQFPTEPIIDWENKAKAEEYKHIALRCLQKEKSKRFQSCNELKEALLSDDYLSDLKLKKVTPQLQNWTSESSNRPRGRKSKLILSIGATCLLLTIFASFFKDTLISAIADCLCSNRSSLFVTTENNYADWLMEIHKPVLAGKILNNLITRYSQEKDPKKIRDTHLKAAKVSLDLKDNAEFIRHLISALNANKELAISSNKDFFNEVRNLLDLAFGKGQPSKEELLIKARFLEELSKASGRSDSSLIGGFDALLFRTLEFMKPGRKPPKGFLDSLARTLAENKITLNHTEESKLSLILTGNGPDPEFLETKLIQQARLNNPGVSKETKVGLRLRFITNSKDDPADRFEKLLKLLPLSADLPRERCEVLHHLARTAEELENHDEALSFLHQLQSLMANVAAFTNPDFGHGLKMNEITTLQALKMNDLARKEILQLADNMAGQEEESYILNLDGGMVPNETNLENLKGALLERWNSLLTASRDDEAAEAAVLAALTRAINHHKTKTPWGSIAREYKTALMMGKIENKDRQSTVKDFLNAVGSSLSENEVLMMQAFEKSNQKDKQVALSTIERIDCTTLTPSEKIDYVRFKSTIIVDAPRALCKKTELLSMKKLFDSCLSETKPSSYLAPWDYIRDSAKLLAEVLELYDLADDSQAVLNLSQDYLRKLLKSDDAKHFPGARQNILANLISKRLSNTDLKDKYTDELLAKLENCLQTDNLEICFADSPGALVTVSEAFRAMSEIEKCKKFLKQSREILEKRKALNTSGKFRILVQQIACAEQKPEECDSTERNALNKDLLSCIQQLDIPLENEIASELPKTARRMLGVWRFHHDPEAALKLLRSLRKILAERKSMNTESELGLIELLLLLTFEEPNSLSNADEQSAIEREFFELLSNKANRFRRGDLPQLTKLAAAIYKNLCKFSRNEEAKSVLPQLRGILKDRRIYKHNIEQEFAEQIKQ